MVRTRGIGLDAIRARSPAPVVNRMEKQAFRRILAASVAIGAVVGAFAAGFKFVWTFAYHHLWAALPDPIWRIPISIGAGLLIGLLFTVTFYPGSLSSLIKMFHDKGRVPLQENVPVVPAGLIGLIAGQSAGPEGVMSAFGGSIGTWVAERFAMDRAVKVLTLAGMGAGFGAILGAPIGGALLWLELPHERGMEYYEALTPTLLASMVGYVVMASIIGFDLFPHWNYDSLTTVNVEYLLDALLICGLCVLAAFLYTKLFGVIGAGFNRLKMPLIVRTTLAGLIIGVAGYLVPLSYFYGGKYITTVLTHNLPIGLLATVAVVKMLTCSFTVQGFWQGGLIIPQMFIGAVLGQLCSHLIPGIPPALAMICGIGAFNAAVTGSPLASALIAIALTHTSSIAPVFLASLIASVASPSIGFIQTAAPRTEEPGFHLGEPLRTGAAD